MRRTVEELEAQVGALLMHMRQPTGDDVGGCVCVCVCVCACVREGERV